MEQLVNQLVSTVKGVWKYRWVSMILAWVIVVAGFVAVLLLPNNYQASARVFVDTQSILKPLLAGMTTIPDVEQQVSIMSKTLLSRPNIERVIRMVDLDHNVQSASEKDALVTELSRDIKIGGTNSHDIYTITYNHADPKLAKNIVQSLLTIFIEGSFGDKKQDSANAVRFIDEQIKQYEEKLTAAENEMKEFKLKNSDVVSGKGGADFSGRLLQAEEQLNQARLELAEAEQARQTIARQIAAEEAGASRAGDTVAVAPNPEIDSRLETLNKQLDSLRLQYTEQHPDVVATKRLIAQLEQRKKQEARPASTIGRSYSPVMEKLKVSLSDAEARVASLRARVGEYGARVAKFRSMRSAVPEVEAQFAQLDRDYQINKANYEKLIASRDAAKLSGDLSATTEMMTFRIIDPPTVPVKPTGPNRPRLFGVVFGAALLVALAVGFVLSQLRPTYLSAAQLRELTGLPVLGSVSMNWTEEEKRRRKKGVMALATSFASMVILSGGALGLLILRS